MTDDQKAMLRLLAQGEASYADIAALKGISVEEVRERVKEALAEVDEPEVSEPAAEPVPQPPAAPAPSVPHGPVPPPESEAPKQAAVPPAAASPVPATKPRRGATQIPSLKLPKDRGALIGVVAGAIVVVILVIVLLIGGDGGGSGGSGSSATPTERDLAENAAAAAENKNLTQAVLAPTDGGDASGRAIFGRLQKKVLLQVTAEGLEPSRQGEMYTVWLYRSPKIALQIGAVPVKDSGKLAAQFEIPVQLLTYVANGAFDQIDIARTDTAEYKTAFAKAKKESKVPPYVGESVLRGPITSPAIRK